ncbi:MAG: hypothetical protein PHC51_07420 [bacterium]|nr:hypothetical protein [bacterium]
MKVTRCEQGSYLLSTALGVVVILSFFGLAVGTVRFLHLRGGLEHAVQKTARCLATDNPACSNSVVGAVDFATDWWGSRSIVSEERSVDHYRYSGRYYNDTYQARASYYESTENAQSFSLSLRSLPVVRYTPYNIHERRFAEVVKTWTAPSNIVVPGSENGMPFDLAFEQSTANMSPEEYFSALAERSPDVVFQRAGLGRFDLGPSAIRQTRRTAQIAAPRLAETVICEAGRDCLADCRNAQDLCPAEFPPRQFYILLKPFFMSSSAGQIKVPDGGFRVNVFDAQGALVYQRNLGGRLPDNSSSDWRSLWLRGPSGSSGDREQLSDHSAISVPNGGSFQVELTLESRNSRSEINAEAMLYYHLPTFEYLPGVETDTRCTVELRPSVSDSCRAEEVNCREACGITEQGSCRVEKEWGEPVCPAVAGGVESKFFPLACRGIFLTPRDAEAAVCGDNWQPAFRSPSSESVMNRTAVYAGEKREWCGFWQKAEISGKVEVPLGASSCPLAGDVATSSQVNCSLLDQGIDTVSGIEMSGLNQTQPQPLDWLKNCPQLQDSLKGWRETLLQLNGQQSRIGAVKFTLPDVMDYVPGPLVPRARLLFWEEPDSHPLRTVRQIAQVSRPLSWTRRVSSAVGQIPVALDFGFAEETPALIGASSANVAIVRTKVTPVELGDESVFGVLRDVGGQEKGSPELDAGYRHARGDCSGEKIVSDSCPVYDSLNELLRQKAGETHPLLVNQELFVEFDEPVYLGNERLSLNDEDQNGDIPGCYAYRHLCEGSEDLHYLGKFSRREFPDGPEICQNGEFGYCYSSGEDFSSSRVNEAASSAAQEEILVKTYFAKQLRQALPDSRGECSEEDSGAGSCFTLHFTRNQFDSLVSAEYRLPLIAPFNWVLGREIQLVSFSKREANER